MSRGYWQAIEALLVPPDWAPEAPEPERERSWRSWRTGAISTINDLLWPSWDADRRIWRNADVKRMQQLTDADFALFDRIIQTDKAMDERPTPPNPAADLPTHRALYLEEDGAQPFGARYERYDSTLDAERARAVAQQIKTALRSKVGSSGLQFKAELQRPRPYQMCVLLGYADFAHELAITSMTPSMSSGHSQQGCLAGAAVYEYWLKSGFTPSADQVVALQQLSVDIGDRRVFAGVHYPSDNLSSWWFALSMAEHVFEQSETRSFLLEAITGRSRVWRYLDTASHDASPYRPMMERILQFRRS